MKKTNAIRELEANKINFDIKEYEVDENNLDAVSVALKINEDLSKVYKTLALTNERNELIIACVAALEKIDLKKLAKVSKSKKVEMLATKDLMKATGYIRGGCSPIGIKKKHLSFINKSVLENKKILVSAGLRGLQIEIAPHLLIEHLKMEIADIIENIEIN